MNIFFKKRTIASLGVLLLCSHNAISETKTKVYNIEASAPVIIKSLSYLNSAALFLARYFYILK